MKDLLSAILAAPEPTAVPSDVDELKERVDDLGETVRRQNVQIAKMKLRWEAMKMWAVPKVSTAEEFKELARRLRVTCGGDSDGPVTPAEQEWMQAFYDSFDEVKDGSWADKPWFDRLIGRPPPSGYASWDAWYTSSDRSV